MSDTIHRGGYRAARRYRRAAIAAIAIGTLALVGATRVGYDLPGLVVYVLGALVGFGLLAYVRLADSLSLGDERLCELERRASHYTVSVFAALGWVGLVGVSLLEATGQRPMTAAEETLLFAFAAFFLVWGGIYLGLRFRR